MQKGQRDWLLFILIVLVITLSTSTTYFFAKSKTLSESSQTTLDSSQLVEPETSPSPTSVSSTTTSVSASTSRLTQPKNLYVVKSGETLQAIAGNFNISYLSLAIANGISEPYNIKIGQNLAIPTLDEKSKKLYIEFTLSQKASDIQKKIENGQNTFYADPIQSAQAQSQGYFGFTFDQSFSEKSKTTEKIILSTKNQNGEFEVELSQPLSKGEKGVWAINKITQIAK